MAISERAAGARGGYEEEVTVRIGDLSLPGDLTVPAAATGAGVSPADRQPAPVTEERAVGAKTGIVVFAHGSGSGRRSPRNRYVASVLSEAGLGTLLLDLLTPEEETDRANVFDIALLAGRLAGATAWLREQVAARDAKIGWFGASTGAGAALWAAGQPAADVAAIVSRGGRPDLAGKWLPAVRAPTMLIVGGLDDTVLQLNRAAQAQLRCPTELRVVPGATHLFEEPGTLEAVAGIARDWFQQHVGRA